MRGCAACRGRTRQEKMKRLCCIFREIGDDVIRGWAGGDDDVAV